MKDNDRVVHSTYGKGRIEQVEAYDGKSLVWFDVQPRGQLNPILVRPNMLTKLGGNDMFIVPNEMGRAVRIKSDKKNIFGKVNGLEFIGDELKSVTVAWDGNLQITNTEVPSIQTAHGTKYTGNLHLLSNLLEYVD